MNSIFAQLPCSFLPLRNVPLSTNKNLAGIAKGVSYLSIGVGAACVIYESAVYLKFGIRISDIDSLNLVFRVCQAAGIIASFCFAKFAFEDEVPSDSIPMRLSEPKIDEQRVRIRKFLALSRCKAILKDTYLKNVAEGSPLVASSKNTYKNFKAKQKTEIESFLKDEKFFAILEQHINTKLEQSEIAVKSYKDLKNVMANSKKDLQINAFLQKVSPPINNPTRTVAKKEDNQSIRG